ncbi:MAG: HEAT repeat domain-containing protein [Planctomycetota bacterium JB042]
MSVGIVVALVAMVLVYKRQVHDELPPPPVDRVIAVLAFEGSPEETARAHDQLLDLDEREVVRKLLAALTVPETVRPEELILALARVGDDAVATEVRPYLQHVDARVRAAAIDALASFGDVGVEPELRRIADADPALGVRQLAVIALADLGADDVDRDLAAVLDETTPAERRESADGSLEVTTGESFGRDRAAAEAWLDARGAPPAATQVGGRGRTDGAPLVSRDGEVEVAVERTGEWLVARVTGAAPPLHLALETATGRILVAVDRRDDGVAARADDLPREGRSFERHESLPVEVSADGVTVRLPRAGRLVEGGEPTAVRVIR